MNRFEEFEDRTPEVEHMVLDKQIVNEQAKAMKHYEKALQHRNSVLMDVYQLIENADVNNAKRNQREALRNDAWIQKKKS